MQGKNFELNDTLHSKVTPDGLHYLSALDRTQFQLGKLTESLAYLYKYSPYYKELFKNNNFKLSDIRSLQDIRSLPFTSKSDIQQYNDHFLCVAQNKVIDHCSTSGTLGEPVHILLTENDLQRLAINEYLGLQLAGVTSSDRIQLTTTMDKRFMAGLAYFLGARSMGCGVIRNGSGFPAMQLETLFKFKPTVIIAVPSFLVKLIDYANDNSIDLKNSSIQKAICIGESIRSGNNKLNSLGQRIHQQWPIELYSTYASSEMQTCFTECEMGNGGHLLSNLIYPEIIDDDGNPQVEGKSGELVITTFGIEGMPLLRYKTGDICSMVTAPCTCGRTSPRLMHISGRKMQMLKIKGTSIYPSAIFNILDECTFISNYATEAFYDHLNGDNLKISISLKPGFNQNHLIEINEKLASGLRLKPAIEVLTFEEIEKKLWKEGARKPSKFIDHRPLQKINNHE